MRIAKLGLILLLAGSFSAAFSWQSAEKSETNPTQTAPKSKDGSPPQKPGSEASKASADADILSDTMGVDFGPYLKRASDAIKTSWYRLVPDSAKAPTLKRGRVAIEFAIMKDGKIRGLTVVSASGQVDLDRAAWGSITHSSPFPPLPADFRGQYLQLRFKFFYNPEKTAGAPEDKAPPAEKKP